jgi:hypothetical protein
MLRGMKRPIEQVLAHNVKAAREHAEQAGRIESRRGAARSAGIAANTLRNLEVPREPGSRGVASTTVDKVAKAAEAYGFDPWNLLVNGFDPQNPPKLFDHEAVIASHPGEIALLRYYRNLSPGDRDALLRMLRIEPSPPKKPATPDPRERPGRPQRERERAVSNEDAARKTKAARK